MSLCDESDDESDESDDESDESDDGTWTDSTLAAPRAYLAATSLPCHGLALFAGGTSSVGDCTSLDIVDIFNASTASWSTAVLSVGRFWLAAASLPSLGLAFFAGGKTACQASPVDVVDIFNASNRSWSTAALGVGRWCLAAASLPHHGLVFFAGGHPSVTFLTFASVVDVLNSTSGSWSTMNLSIARSDIAASSLPSQGLVFFAGGQNRCVDAPIVLCEASKTVDIFDAKSLSRSTAAFRVARFALAGSFVPDSGMALFAGGCNASYSNSSSNIVDIYNWSDGSWNSASMSRSRTFLMSASLPNYALAIFSGGADGCAGASAWNSSNQVDIFDATSGFWSTAIRSVPRQSLAATSLPDHGLAMSAGGLQSIQNLNGSLVGVYSNVVDIFTAASSPPFTTTPQPPSSTITSTISTTAPPTSLPPPVPNPVPRPPIINPIPTWIVIAAAATSSRLPRALELVQFLTIYCTSLSSEQQLRVSAFQVAPIMHIPSSHSGAAVFVPDPALIPWHW